MQFVLEEHGDEVEQEFWPRIKGLVPRYEQFWQNYIAPLTYRTLDPGNIHLRIGPPPELRNLANAVYRGFKLVTEATTSLDNPNMPSDDKTCREFFENMYALTDSYRTILGSLRKIVKLYGGTSIADPKARFIAAGLSASWSSHEDSVQTVSNYRTPYSHITPPPRYGKQIPRREALGQYKQTSDIQTRRDAGDDVAADFVDPRILAERMLKDGARSLDLVIVVALHELSALPKQNALTGDIQRTTSDDHRLASDTQYWTALSGVVPQTHGVLVTRHSEIGGIQHDEV